MPISKASNAVLAKARALYGRRLTATDYQAFAACHTMPELADALKSDSLYADALEQITPATARRANIELALRSSVFTRYASLCRYEMSAGQKMYRYFIFCCDLDEIMTWLRYLDSGRPGDYLFVLPDFLQKHTRLDLYGLAKARSLNELLNVLRGTPYGTALAPLAGSDAAGGVLVRAAPILERLRHETLVALAPNKTHGGSGRQPSIRDYIERECDVRTISYAARMKHMHFTPTEIRSALLLDCTALSHTEWDALLTAEDDNAFEAALGKTVYGRELAGQKRDYLEEDLEDIQFCWCRKWLRFSTDPALVMLCYIFLAKDEVSNLNHIIEGVHYGLPAEDILPLLNGWETA